ncbi:MAG: ornithine carbamoyltransferase [Planctomycetes bacterium]|nr:ornithine carbamoyltransferase [Planctomycetota bacterium]
MRTKHLVAIKDLSTEEILEIFHWARKLKGRWAQGIRERALEGKVVGMIFEKSSMRTRVSFEVAVLQLSGHSIYLDRDSIGLGVRETIKDVARVMSRYVDGIVVRTFEHHVVKDLARYSTVPVINGLSDYLHPCQGLSDLFTIQERFGSLEGLRVAFVGDGNNVARSLATACVKLGVHFAIASPAGYVLDAPFVSRLQKLAARTGASTRHLRDPVKAVRGANVIYTDVWTSMGQEDEAEQRRKAFSRYRVTRELVSAAGNGAVVMHCLPAHRGDEITDEVMDGPFSIVYEQAENRLHVQKAILRLLLAPPASSGPAVSPSAGSTPSVRDPDEPTER